MTTVQAPSTELVLPGNRQLPEYLRNPAELPPELQGLIDLSGWLRSLATRVDYVEPNPGFMEARMLLLGLMAEDEAAVMSSQAMDGLQKLVPNAEGASSGNIMVDDLYVAPSTQKDGNKTYMIITFTYERSGTSVTTSTGATNLQRQFIQLLALGKWPLEGQFLRLPNTDRGGRHIFQFAPLDVA